MVAGSFKWVGERFDGIDKQFGAVGERLDDIDNRLDSMDTRLDRIENLLLRDHLNRIERLEDSMLLVKRKIGVR